VSPGEVEVEGLRDTRADVVPKFRELLNKGVLEGLAETEREILEEEVSLPVELTLALGIKGVWDCPALKVLTVDSVIYALSVATAEMLAGSALGETLGELEKLGDLVEEEVVREEEEAAGEEDALSESVKMAEREGDTLAEWETDRETFGEEEGNGDAVPL